jgi:uncharacterized protein (TIGR03067 family)
MRRLALPLLLALPSLGFAPAPFPKAERNARKTDLERLQGWWVEVKHNGEPSRVEVEVRGNVWNNSRPGDAWRITLDPHARPPRIDLVAIAPQRGHFRGIYKFEGDTFVYSLRYREKGSEKDRPRDFDTSQPGAWVTVFERRHR